MSEHNVDTDADADAADVTEPRFKVTSIERTEPPEGGESGKVWHEYIIGRGESAIRGKRAGSQRSVEQHAREFADNLNRRASLGYSPYAARRQQQK